MTSPALIMLATVATYILRSGCGGAQPHMADTDLTDPLAFGQEFQAVCRVGERGGDGTLIAPEWVLTAGHVAQGIHARDGGRMEVQFENGERFGVKQVYLHPRFEPMGRYDIALLLLDGRVSGVEPVPCHTGDDELGRLILIAGHGDRRNADGSWLRDGRLRAYTNQIDAVDDTHLVFDYDPPGPGATTLEGTSGPGDSGGPAFLRTAEGLRVAGVSSMGEPGSDGPCSFGAVEHFVRVSRFQDWIADVMRAPDEHPTINTATSAPARTDVAPTTRLGGSPREQAAQRIVDALATGDPQRLEEAIAATYAPAILARRDAATIVRNMPALVEQLSGSQLEELVANAPDRISLRMENRGEHYGLDLFFQPSGGIKQMAFGRLGD